MMRGRFITLEGGEGAGKSTQARLLADGLRARGHDVLLTREPGGTPGAEAIRALLLASEHDWDARAEALLFAAARADHVTRAIAPALAAGQWVVCDRFLDSSRAYQGGADALTDEAILALHATGSRGLLPDRTILLQAPDAVTLARLAARDGDQSDRIGGRSADYHRAVAERFRNFAEAEPERFRTVDAAGTPEDVQARILAALAPLLEDAP
jgi:dTMP kinase